MENAGLHFAFIAPEYKKHPSIWRPYIFHTSASHLNYDLLNR
jgi:hypothetical protein